MIKQFIIMVAAAILTITTATASDFKTIKQQAEQGDAVAQYKLGEMYDKGEGVEQDYTKAVYWFTKAAEQGFSVAQFDLGLMYENGDIIPQDLKKAVELYTKASEQGNAYAQLKLGLMYEKGDGVTQDYKKAVEYYTMASEQAQQQGIYWVKKDAKKALADLGIK